MLNRCFLFLFALLFGWRTFAQDPAVPAEEETFAPTWETQKQARTYLLGIPAPRGQITDRNGNPLAQNKVGYNLTVEFPTPLNFSNKQALAFAHQQINVARGLIKREINISDDFILKHYRNRAVLPLEIAQNLLPFELELIKEKSREGLGLRPVYLRFYPNGSLAAHVIGYAGKTGRTPDAPLQNNELMWPSTEGREGLEQKFNEQLSGQIGQMNIAFDPTGKKVSERISIPPEPGYNIVTTIDRDIQALAEKTLSEGASRGAIVILDPNNGDILALASWPVFNPNAFIPNISEEAFKALKDNPNIPLLPRAFRSAYPPGSVFKIFVGLAALESGAISFEDEFSCPTAFNIGNLTFHNWKKEHAGMLTFADALTQSCNTWFYQVGLKTGGKPIIDWAFKLGLGEKTAIPVAGEVAGRIPTDEYMMQKYRRKMGKGDIANLAIGQGDILISPLQMAQAMGAIGNGGTLYQTRLVQQLQGIDNQIITAYDVRATEQLGIKPEILAEIKKAMIAVVSSGMGTAAQARVDNIVVAGKTGTAQWGPKNKERTAAWFAGFAPADKPKYAFAALFEGNPNDDDVHGGSNAAPLIGKVLRELYKVDLPPKKSKKKRPKARVD